MIGLGQTAVRGEPHVIIKYVDWHPLYQQGSIVRSQKGIVPLFAAILAVGLAAGCTATTPDLPTISGASSPGAKTLESIAQTYADCMMAAGISVEIQPNQTGEITIVL